MRIKALILSAAFGAVGIATSMAQVYSVNGVGYYTLTLGSGFNMIANQLNVAGGNTLNAIIPNAPDGTTLAKFDAVAGAFLPDDVHYAGYGWFTGENVSTTTLNPGEGAFINMSAPADLTFVGEIPQGQGAEALRVTIYPNFSIISQPTPQSIGVYATGAPSTDGDTIAFWDPSANGGSGGYEPDVTFYAGYGWFAGEDNIDPTPEVGEAFFYNSAAPLAVDWTRDFSIND